MVPTVHANWRYFEMYDKDGKIVDQLVWWRTRFNTILPYLKTMQNTFIKPVKQLATNIMLNFIQRIKNVAMNIFTIRTEMKAEVLAACFLIIAKHPKQ